MWLAENTFTCIGTFSNYSYGHKWSLASPTMVKTEDEQYLPLGIECKSFPISLEMKLLALLWQRNKIEHRVLWRFKISYLCWPHISSTSLLPTLIIKLFKTCLKINFLLFSFFNNLIYFNFQLIFQLSRRSLRSWAAGLCERHMDVCTDGRGVKGWHVHCYLGPFNLIANQKLPDLPSSEVTDITQGPCNLSWCVCTH